VDHFGGGDVIRLLPPRFTTHIFEPPIHAKVFQIMHGRRIGWVVLDARLAIADCFVTDGDALPIR